MNIGYVILVAFGDRVDYSLLIGKYFYSFHPRQFSLLMMTIDL